MILACAQYEYEDRLSLKEVVCELELLHLEAANADAVAAARGIVEQLFHSPRVAKLLLGKHLGLCDLAAEPEATQRGAERGAVQH